MPASTDNTIARKVARLRRRLSTAQPLKPIEAGEYSIRIVPRAIHMTGRAGTRGISFIIEITEGQYRGREIVLDLRLEGKPPFIVERNLQLLAVWAKITGAPKAVTPVEMIAALGRLGEHRRILLRLEVSGKANGRTWINPIAARLGQ